MQISTQSKFKKTNLSQNCSQSFAMQNLFAKNNSLQNDIFVSSSNTTQMAKNIAFKGIFDFLKPAQNKFEISEEDEKYKLSKKPSKDMYEKELPNLKGSDLFDYFKEKVPDDCRGYQLKSWSNKFVDNYFFIRQAIDKKVTDKPIKDTYIKIFIYSTCRWYDDTDYMKESIIKAFADRTPTMTEYEKSLTTDYLNGYDDAQGLSSNSEYNKNKDKFREARIYLKLKTIEDVKNYSLSQTEEARVTMKTLKSIADYPNLFDDIKRDFNVEDFFNIILPFDTRSVSLTNYLIDTNLLGITLPYSDKDKEDFEYTFNKFLTLETDEKKPIQDFCKRLDINHLNTIIDNQNPIIIKYLQKTHPEKFFHISADAAETLHKLDLPPKPNKEMDFSVLLLSNGLKKLETVNDFKNLVEKTSVKSLDYDVDEKHFFHNLLNLPYNEETKDDFERIFEEIKNSNETLNSPDINSLQMAMRWKNIPALKYLQEKHSNLFAELSQHDIKCLCDLGFKFEINPKNGVTSYIYSNNVNIYDLDFHKKLIKDGYGNFYDQKINGVTLLETLLDIPYTEENKSDFEEIADTLSKIDEIDWQQKDDVGNNLLLRAIIAENPIMAKLFSDKKISIDERNQNDESGLDVLTQIKTQNPNSEVLKMQYHSNDMLKLARVKFATAVNLFLKNPFVDPNSTDEDGNNTAMLLAENNIRSIYELDLSKTNLNYVSPNGESILTKIFTKNSSIDFDDNHNYSRDEVMNFFIKNNDIDFSILHNGETIETIIKDRIDLKKSTSILNFISEVYAKRMAKQFAENVDKNYDAATLEEIEHFINHPGFEFVMKKALGKNDYNIVEHLLLVEVTEKNVYKILDLLEKLYNKNCISDKDLSLAIKAKNDIAVDFIKNKTRQGESNES